MKKFLTLLLSALMILGVCMGLTACKDPGNNEYARTVTLGFDAEFPPYGYLDAETGEYAGFDIEFAKKVCEELNYKLILQPIDWNAKDAMLSSGGIDFIWNGFTYEGREDGYTWTDRYLNNSIVVLTADASINTLADLAGKKVAAQEQSSGEVALNKMTDLVASFANGTFATEASYVTANEKLLAGAYDAVVVDFGVAQYLQAANSSLKILDEAVAQESYAVGFLKGNTELCNIINAKMNEVAEDSAFIQGLCTKYGVDYNAFLLGK